MAGLTFEGALENISDVQINFIKETLEKRGFKNKVVRVEAISIAGDNYIANVKRIIVDDDSGPFKMIAKIAPQNDAMRMETKAEYLFEKEHLMYTVILPKFQQLEEMAGVPKEERFRYAEWYGSYIQAPNEIILLEDLVTLGFEMLDKSQSLSDECVRSTLENLAKFHSLSFALKHIEPETYNSIKIQKFDRWGPLTESFKIYIENIEKGSEELVDGDVRKRIIKGAISEGLAMAAEVNESTDTKYFIIQQADCWINNIMFRYDDGRLAESIMIDYQLSKETISVYDIQFMIFNCTDHKTRLRHFKDWLDYYRSKLEKKLLTFNLRLEDVYPRKQFEVDMKKYSKMMFGISVIIGDVLTKDTEEISKMRATIESTSTGEQPKYYEVENKVDSKIKFKSRMEDLIDSCLEFDLINLY